MSLVTGGVETKLGPTREEDQLDQILPHSRSQGKENKTYISVWEVTSKKRRIEEHNHIFWEKIRDKRTK